MKRLDSIDITRAIAIFLMIMCHFTNYITRPKGAFPAVYFFGDHILGDSPAAMFLFLVGISLSISIHKSRQNDISESSLLSRLIIRGAVVFIFGIIFQIVVWGYTCSFDWDILTTIGSCIILLAFLRNLAPRQLVLLVIVIAILTPCLRHMFGYPAFWEDGEYAAPWTIKAVLGGFFLNAYFPLLPWLAYSLMGLAVGKAIFIEQDVAIRSKSRRKLFATGAVLLIAGFGGFIINYYTGLSGIIAVYVSKLSIFPLSSTLFLIEGGFVLLLFGLLIRFDLENIKHPFMDFMRRYSRYSLSVYVIHHLLIVFIPRMIGIYLYKDEYYYYRNMFEPPTGLLLSVIFIFVFYPILILWDKVKGIGSFEWCVNKLIPKNQ